MTGTDVDDVDVWTTVHEVECEFGQIVSNEEAADAGEDGGGACRHKSEHVPAVDVEVGDFQRVEVMELCEGVV